MRLSADQDDVGFEDYIRTRRRKAIIKLDGKVMDKVITADTSAGFVVRVVTDPNGLMMVDPKNEGQVLTERLTGKVDITFEDGDAAEG
jgi:hypothetical protein